MTVTGQCDHIVGLVLSSYPQDGGMDGLGLMSEGVKADEPFNYCPLCGKALNPDKSCDKIVQVIGSLNDLIRQAL